MSRRSLKPLLFAALAALGVCAAHAQDYPSRPVKVIVPFSAGGPLDLVARSLGDKLAASLKQPFIVENRTGAGGNIGTEAAAKADPDGHTLLVVLSATLTANPALYPKLPFAPASDFQPISLLTNSSQMLVVHPSVPVNSVVDFVALAKQKYGLRGRDVEKMGARFVPFTAQSRMSGVDLDGAAVRKGAGAKLEGDEEKLTLEQVRPLLDRWIETGSTFAAEQLR